MSLNTFDDIAAIGTRGTSTRLAAFRAANGLDRHGFPLDGSKPDGADAPLPAPTAIPSTRATIAPKPAPKASAPTAAQIEQARQRARHDAVMNSLHAKGRQCTAAGLLGGAPNLSAEQIIAILPTMPTDAQAVEIARRARAAAMWERVIAASSGKSAVTTGNKAWDRVIAGMMQ